MDCGISFGLNKWALTSGLGLLSFGGYETYQLAVKPVSASRHFSIEPMEFKVEEIEEPQPIETLETSPEATISEQETKLETPEENPTVISLELPSEEDIVEIEPKAEVEEEVEEEVETTPPTITTSSEAEIPEKTPEKPSEEQDQKPNPSTCLVKLTQHHSRSRLSRNGYRGRFFC